MKTTFALLIGSRGTFPAKLIGQARAEMTGALERLDHSVLLLDEAATSMGAVETPAEGKVFAQFLHANRGKYQGIILCLPNFGSEGGIIAALKDADVPILIHAYPDELDKLGTATRRDAFCGKFAVLNILCQYGVRFTNLEPHTVHPNDPDFARNIDHFDRVCRAVAGMQRFTRREPRRAAESR